MGSGNSRKKFNVTGKSGDDASRKVIHVVPVWGGKRQKVYLRLQSLEAVQRSAEQGASHVKMVLECSGLKWEVDKGLTDFLALHSQLQSLGLPLPSSIEKSLEAERLALSSYLDELFALTAFTQHHCVLRFLEIIEHIPLLSCDGFQGLLCSSGCEIKHTEERAITLEQLDALLCHIKRWCQPAGWRAKRGWALLLPESVNLYDAVDYVVKPATAKRQCSFVELLAQRPQKPTWFVSHWWGEPVSAFMCCLQQHSADRELQADAAYWICAYANNQWQASTEVGDDPAQSSFRRAMDLAQGTVSIVDSCRTCYTRIWCCYEVSVSLDPNSQHREHGEYLYDIYTMLEGTERRMALPKGVGLTDGLAKVDLKGHPAHHGSNKVHRESRFPTATIKGALSTKLQKGEASVAEDRRRILNSIVGAVDLMAEPPERHAKYDDMDCALAGRFAAAGLRNALDTGEDMHEFFLALSKARQHRLVLDLAQCKNIDMDALSAALPQNFVQDLWINFYDSQFSSNDLSTLCSSLPPGLLHLKLDLGGCLALTTLDGLFEGLAQLACLRSCELHFGRATNLQTVHSVGNAGIVFPSLETLEIHFDECTGLRSLDGIGDVVSGLPRLQTCVLNFEACSELQSLGDLRKGIASFPILNSPIKLNFCKCSRLDPKEVQDLATGILQPCCLEFQKADSSTRPSPTQPRMGRGRLSFEEEQEDGGEEEPVNCKRKSNFLQAIRARLLEPGRLFRRRLPDEPSQPLQNHQSFGRRLVVGQ